MLYAHTSVSWHMCARVLLTALFDEQIWCWRCTFPNRAQTRSKSCAPARTSSSVGYARCAPPSTRSSLLVFIYFNIVIFPLLICCHSNICIVIFFHALIFLLSIPFFKHMYTRILLK